MYKVLFKVLGYVRERIIKFLSMISLVGALFAMSSPPRSQRGVQQVSIPTCCRGSLWGDSVPVRGEEWAVGVCSSKATSEQRSVHMWPEPGTLSMAWGGRRPEALSLCLPTVVRVWKEKVGGTLKHCNDLKEQMWRDSEEWLGRAWVFSLLFNWSLIVLQCCVSCYYTLKRISYMYN